MVPCQSRRVLQTQVFAFRVSLILKKAYERVVREKLWYYLKRSSVTKKYISVVQDMNEGSETAVRCAVGVPEKFKLKVELHHGLVLGLFLFVFHDGQVDI